MPGNRNHVENCVCSSCTAAAAAYARYRDDHRELSDYIEEQFHKALAEFERLAERERAAGYDMILLRGDGTPVTSLAEVEWNASETCARVREAYAKQDWHRSFPQPGSPAWRAEQAIMAPVLHNHHGWLVSEGDRQSLINMGVW